MAVYDRDVCSAKDVNDDIKIFAGIHTGIKTIIMPVCIVPSTND